MLTFCGCPPLFISYTKAYERSGRVDGHYHRYKIRIFNYFLKRDPRRLSVSHTVAHWALGINISFAWQFRYHSWLAYLLPATQHFMCRDKEEKTAKTVKWKFSVDPHSFYTQRSWGIEYSLSFCRFRRVRRIGATEKALDLISSRLAVLCDEHLRSWRRIREAWLTVSETYIIWI